MSDHDARRDAATMQRAWLRVVAANRRAFADWRAFGAGDDPPVRCASLNAVRWLRVAASEWFGPEHPSTVTVAPAPADWPQDDQRDQDDHRAPPGRQARSRPTAPRAPNLAALDVA